MMNRRPTSEAETLEFERPKSDLSKLDLGRYQIATIPTHLQIELAALERPLLSPEALIPPPPVTHASNEHGRTGAGQSSGTRRPRRRYWVAIGLAVALFIFILGWQFGMSMARIPEPPVVAPPST